MSVRSFFDTNILVYAEDHDEPRKQKIAHSILERAHGDQSGVISTQILQEYFATATRKLSIPAEIARAKMELFSHLAVVKIDVPDVLAAVDIHRLHSISFWDALVVRAAKEGGCKVLYSEDLQHGWTIEGVKVVNPFRK